MKNVDLNRDRPFTAEDPKDVVFARFIVPTKFCCRFPIVDRGGADGCPDWGRGNCFEQSRSKRKQVRPRASRALREYRQRPRIIEFASDCFNLSSGLAAFVSAHVHRVILVGHPMDQRVPKL